MTDRVHSLTVALDRDIRTDDVEPLMKAIHQMRGVVGVAASVVDPIDWAARTRIKAELAAALFNVLHGEAK